jgi:hypothetical protein
MATKERRTGPDRIRFRGQELAFTAEVRYLIADEVASTMVGVPEDGRHHDPTDAAWKRAITASLDLFDKAGLGQEGYEWIVTPNQSLDYARPLDLIRLGRIEEVLEEAVRHLSDT